MAKQLGKEGKTGKGAKADDAQRQEEIGGNLTQEVFLQSVHELVEINKDMRQLNEKRRKIRKTLKARGIELGIMDEEVRKAEWDRDEVRAHYDTQRKYATWLGLPIGSQPDLFKDMTAEQIRQVEWEAHGATAFKAALAESPPETCPEDCKLAWHRGWKKAAGIKVDKVKEPKAEKGAKGEGGKARVNEQGKVIAPPVDPDMERDFEQGGKAAPEFN